MTLLLKKSKQKSAYSQLLPGLEFEGVIVSHLGVAVEVLSDTGERHLVKVKRRSGHVVGDRVVIKGEVLLRLPRKTELRRRDAMGQVHLVGANLDVLGIVVSPMPAPPAGFVDRAIVAARVEGLKPFIIANKCDLVSAKEFVLALQDTYGSTIPVFPLSATAGSGLDLVRAFLGEGHRGAFVGTTGVGKSSLLNAICPAINLRVGDLNVHSGKGCNTTTVSTLHLLAGGGELIDTPGFQDFGLVDITPQELADHFPGFDQLDEYHCRFRNCRHRSEPGCAIVDSARDGMISSERYGTYLAILGEVEKNEAEARVKGWKG